MSGQNSLFERVRPGPVLSWKSLTVHPLIASAASAAPSCLLLEQGVREGLVRIAEVSPAGSVPEVVVTNDADLPVLMLQGEELAGARQNRSLNVTVLAPPRSSIVVPVCCVEQGRWFRRSEYFSVPGNLLFPEVRASCTEAVSSSLLRKGVRRADQSDVWHRIGEKSRQLHSASTTRALCGVFDVVKAELAEFTHRLQPLPGQVGAVFEIGSRIAGLDIFEHSAIYSSVAERLVKSYAVDALASGAFVLRRDMGRAAKFLAAADNAIRTYIPAVGLGTECRLAGRFLHGQALIFQGRPVHVCAFRSVAASWGTTSMSPQLRKAGQPASVSPRPLRGKRAPRD